jgi:phospholipid/cholesterol/gamma-HCH transport system substrate-binding protein
METKANYLMIGGFVLGVIVLAFLFVYWMSNFGGGGQSYYILFQNSVAGLTTDSPVSFNGIKVGEVKSIDLDKQDARKVLVTVGVRSGIPVRANSHATIQSQGLTGGSGIEISAGTPDAPLLVATDAVPIPYIKADLAVSQSLFDAAPQVMGNANALLGRLNDLVANNEDSIHKSLTNVEQLTTMLAQRKDDINQIIVNAKVLTTQFRSIADKVDKTVDKIQYQVTDDKTGALAQARAAATSFRELADKLNKSFGDNAEGLTLSAKQSLQEFNEFMREGRHAAETLDSVLSKLENNPKEFLLGGNQVPEYTPKSSTP